MDCCRLFGVNFRHNRHNFSHNNKTLSTFFKKVLFHPIIKFGVNLCGIIFIGTHFSHRRWPGGPRGVRRLRRATGSPSRPAPVTEVSELYRQQHVCCQAFSPCPSHRSEWALTATARLLLSLLSKPQSQKWVSSVVKPSRSAPVTEVSEL